MCVKLLTSDSYQNVHAGAYFLMYPKRVLIFNFNVRKKQYVKKIRAVQAMNCQTKCNTF